MQINAKKMHNSGSNLLYQLMNPTKLGIQKTNYKVLPKLLQMWIHLQTPIQHHQSERDPLDMQQKRADI